MTDHKSTVVLSSDRSRLVAGYSYKTNQYGLAVDNVVAHNVVLPDGTAVTATEDEYKDLFWALKVSSTARSSKPNCCLTTSGRAEGTTSYVIGRIRIVRAERGSRGIQGIVTSFVLKTHPQVGGVWVSTGHIGYCSCELW